MQIYINNLRVLLIDSMHAHPYRDFLLEAEFLTREKT